jgi:GGDEF domain-containing protein
LLRPLLVTTVILALSMWALALLTGAALIAPLSVLLTLALAEAYMVVNETDGRLAGKVQQLLRRMTLQREVQNGKRLHIHDPATGLLERWYFDFRLSEEAARCSRYRLSLAVVVLKTRSVDGRPDRSAAELEEHVARTVSRCLRSVDFATRLAELEFAVCLPRSDESGAEAAVKQLISELGQWHLVAGFAVCPRDGEDGELLMERAQRHECLNDDLGAVVVRRPTYRREAFDLLIREASVGSVTQLELHPGETARSLKQRMQRASKRLGVDLAVWDEGGRVCFKKAAAAPFEAKVA